MSDAHPNTHPWRALALAVSSWFIVPLSVYGPFDAHAQTKQAEDEIPAVDSHGRVYPGQPPSGHLPVQFPRLQEPRGIGRQAGGWNPAHQPHSFHAYPISPWGEAIPTPYRSWGPGSQYRPVQPTAIANPRQAFRPPGDPSTLPKQARTKFRQLIREARRREHRFTGRLMEGHDALEALYEKTPHPNSREVGEIYGRIFAVQREMIEDRVRLSNQIHALFKIHPSQRPATEPSDGKLPKEGASAQANPANAGGSAGE